MQKLKQIGRWLDEHILEVLAYFLIVFIPLYPKLPLFEAIPGYIVRVRLEDIVILVTGVIWLVQLYRQKISWKTPLTWLIGAYAVVGLLSTISAVLITQTVPNELLHIGKTVLHYFRYLEYFFLFFLVVTSIKTKKQFQIVFSLLIVTLLALAVYGYGQRNWFWPVYSTMNREFSKGIRLYLTEHARVQSTFGGHYDLAAYLVIILPILLAAWYLIQKRFVRWGVAITFLSGLWLLVQTSSRSSGLGFVVASYIVIALFTLLQGSWFSRLKRFVLHSTLYAVLLIAFTMTFGQDMQERLLQTLKSYPETYKRYEAFEVQRKETIAYSIEQLNHYFPSTKEMNEEKPKPTPPPNSISTDEALEQVLVKSDTRPTPARPSDVYVDIPDITLVATESADGTITIIEVESERTYSDTALQKGLSAGIRYDTLWPRAIAGFKNNPLLGSGYATLTKEFVGIFTEAESTDNNFLRTLGETGVLGFITFYGVILLCLKMAWLIVRACDTDIYKKIFAAGFIGGTIGLLVNALYIDVFAASKVAFTFWAVAGIVTAAYMQSTSKTDQAPANNAVSTDTFANMLRVADQSKSAQKSSAVQKGKTVSARKKRK